MNIKIASRDGETLYLDIDDENHVDEEFIKSLFPGIIGVKYQVEN